VLISSKGGFSGISNLAYLVAEFVFFFPDELSAEFYFSKWPAMITKGKKGVNHFKSPKRGRKLFYFIWRGCRHIYVYWLQY
jgi:hypothetical protein